MNLGSHTTSPPPLLSHGDVAALLGVPLRTLTWWIYALDEDRRYDYFEIARRDGRMRPIHAPIQPIKELQRTLANHLTDWYSPPAHAHGFVRGRSPSSNASPHRRQQWVLRVDLADFFPSIHFGRVRGMFGAFPFEFPLDVATLLAHLCCYRKQLPQGAPTSPVISNFISRGLDKRAAELARKERCHYTRFADDLTFSTDRTVFPASLGAREGPVGVAGPALEKIIKDEGFLLNVDKTRLTRRTQRQRVTGLVVNNKLSVPRDYSRSLRNLLYIWRAHGEASAAKAFASTNPHPNWPPGKSSPDFRLVIRGRVQYVGSIKGWTDPVYTSLSEALSAVDPTYKHRDQSPFTSSRPVRIYTEGPTDIEHLRAALAHFHTQNEFSNLVFDFAADSSRGGDSQLKRLLWELPGTQPEIPTICLFDRDNEGVLRELGLAQTDWKDVGNGVVAAALVIPDFRNAPLCIEMLYPDADLARTDADGRHVFLASEFDSRTGHHVSGTSSVPNPKHKSLVSDEVYEFGTRKSLAMSKAAFAQAVVDADPPFDAVSFEGFRPTFEALTAAVAAVAGKVTRVDSTA